jgi:hypothetical protein
VTFRDYPPYFDQSFVLLSYDTLKLLIPSFKLLLKFFAFFSSTKMKPSWLGWSLLSLLAAPALGTPSDASSNQVSGDTLVKRGSRGVDPDTPTTFNGVEVPPLTQLTPDNFKEVTKDGYW